MNQKFCGRCKTNKDWTEFHKDKQTKDGRTWSCKECAKAHNAKRFVYRPRNRMISSAKERAKELNLPFNITKEDIDIPDICPVLGIPIFYSSGKKRPTHNSPSLDRIIPEVGYVKGNVKVISYKANTIKSDATLEDLVKVTKWLKEELSQHPSGSQYINLE